MKTKHVTKLFAGFSITLAVQTAFVGNITDINVSTLPDSQRIIKIRSGGDVTTPRGSVISTPARTASDLANTNTRLPQSVLEYADPLLHRIIVVQNNDRARIVLGSNKINQYNTEIRDNEVQIFINESTDQTNAAIANERTATPSTARAAQTYQAVSAANIDFRKGIRNSGIIELSALGFSRQPDIKQRRDRVVVTLKNYTLPTQAQRSLDAADFNTPVQNVTLRRIGNSTQLIIRNNNASWDVNTKASSERLVFEVSPEAANTGSDGLSQNANRSFKGRKIPLDFQDVEIRTILQILAKESGVNIVASDTVKGTMTLPLKEAPWDQALDLVMQTRNLDIHRQGNIINIAPHDELLAKDKAFLQTEKEIAKLGSLYSQTFQLKYKNVEGSRKILRLEEYDSNNSNIRNTLLSNRDSALIDPATNTLIITDNHGVIERFHRLIDELDVLTRQVMVEVRIMEAEDTFFHDLGVKFDSGGASGHTAWGSNWGNAQANHNASTSFNRGDTDYPTWSLDPNVSLPTAVAVNSIALVHAFSSGALGLEVNASKEQGKSKTISNPRVLTQDRKETKIESDTEIPYQEASSSSATSVTFKKVTLGLTVTPNVTPDDQIIMAVKISRDTPINCTVDSLITKCINTKHSNIQAMVEDGGVLIIGGIYEEESTNATNKVPILGDIPVVGNLFKSRGKCESRRELLIFITPCITDNVGNSLRH